MDVLVVGAGSMGRWIGDVFRSGAESGLIDRGELALTFYDQQEDVAAKAAEATGGTAVSAITDEYDVVCIAVPMPVVTEAIAEHATRARDAVLDVAGTMGEPVDAFQTHAAKCERCSLHPLFSPENEPGNVPIVVDRAGPVTKALRETLTERGNHVFETTPEEHDEVMETVQAKTHAAVLAFGLASEGVPEEFHTTISGELFALLEQVISGKPHVYADIQEAFDGADDVASAAALLADADHGEFEALIEQIRTKRDAQ